MSVNKSVLFLLASLFAGAAQADWSANLGFASDYYYRGIFQSTSSASGGIDYENGGFYAGTWAADVKDGLEIDGYFGYGANIGDIGYSVGYTGYFYTGDFDDTYQEVNLGAAFGYFALDVAIGQYENFAAPAADYAYYAISVERNGFHGKLASFAQDFSGEYLELGYSTSVADIDLGAKLLFSSSELSRDGESDQALIFTIGKSFDL